ncbi:hypothetical protein ACOME3_006951 [Neoechinorhynchus agilis]
MAALKHGRGIFCVLRSVKKLLAMMNGFDKSQRATNVQLSDSPANGIESRASLKVFQEPAKTRLTKIVCTIGPSTQSVEMLKELVKAGMNVARLNFSHGNHDYHLKTIENVRRACVNENGERIPVGIALDTKGPEIRTGLLEQGDEVELKTGSETTVTVDERHRNAVTDQLIFIDYKNMPKVCQRGSRIFIDDGNICLTVKDIQQNEIKCHIEAGGVLKNQKGVNLPGTAVDLPAITEKDREDIRFGIQNDVDFIFASFIRDGNGVGEIRKVIENSGYSNKINIISKIESQQGIDNFDEILKESDGIMVARGDMGVEIDAEQVFVAQRMIVAKAQLAGKPVIVATQMLDSMTKRNRPTRAEVTDVGFAVTEGCDAVMLSAESASGDYPIEAVQMQDKISRTAEINFPYLENLFEFERHVICSSNSEQITNPDLTAHIMLSAAHAAFLSKAVAVIVLTEEGGSVERLAKYRIKCPIICVTRNERTARSLTLVRNCFPVFIEQPALMDLEQDRALRIEAGQSEIIALKLCENPPCPVIVVIGELPSAGRTNSLYICSM